MRFLGELSSADQLRVCFGFAGVYVGLLCFGMGEDSYGQGTGS